MQASEASMQDQTGERTRGEAIVFVGTFEHALDGKGRVVLPSQFRNALAGRGILSKYEDCLGLWTVEGFEEVLKTLQGRVRAGEAPPNSIRALTAQAAQVEPDTQGRILIPVKLREFAQLDRDVAIVGLGDRIEIWNTEKWGPESDLADESFIDVVKNLGL